MTSSLSHGRLAKLWPIADNEWRDEQVGSIESSASFYVTAQFLELSTTNALFRYDSINRSYVRMSKTAHISIFRMHFALPDNMRNKFRLVLAAESANVRPMLTHASTHIYYEFVM